MPVLECQCGMIISVTHRGPRTRCIRCGRDKFLFLWSLVTATSSQSADAGCGQFIRLPYGLTAAPDPRATRVTVPKTNDGSPSRFQPQKPDGATPSSEQPPTTIEEARDRLDWLENLRHTRAITEAAYAREKARILASVFPWRKEGGPRTPAS